MIKLLRQKHADLVAEGEKTMSAAEAEGRILNDSEAKRLDEINAELESTAKQIKSVEKQMDQQRALGVIKDPNALIDNARDIQRKETFSFGDMLISAAAHAMSGRTDPRLQFYAATGANESVSADGGFLVDQPYVGDIMQNAWETGNVMSRTYKLPIGPSSNGIKLRGIDETSRVNGSRWGGLQSYWTGEAQSMTASQTKFKELAMELQKITALTYVTDELLADSTALEAFVKSVLPQELEFKTEDAILNGTGTGMPLGFLNSPALITAAKEAGQPNGTIVPENVVNMWKRMPAARRAKAAWLVNQDIEPQLLLMNMKVKNVAGTENVGGLAIPQVIYNPPGFAGQTMGTLMGIPVIVVEYCATLGTAGDILLVDLSQYAMIEKGGVQQASSIHVRFLQNETAFRFVYRVNGMPLWHLPITPYKGTNTVSPFIALQTR